MQELTYICIIISSEHGFSIADESAIGLFYILYYAFIPIALYAIIERYKRHHSILSILEQQTKLHSTYSEFQSLLCCQ